MGRSDKGRLKMSNDFVSVIKPKASENKEGAEKHASLPVMPVRDTVLFPHAVLPLTVGRESSIQLIQSMGEEIRCAFFVNISSTQSDSLPLSLSLPPPLSNRK